MITQEEPKKVEVILEKSYFDLIKEANDVSDWKNIKLEGPFEVSYDAYKTRLRKRVFRNSGLKTINLFTDFLLDEEEFKKIKDDYNFYIFNKEKILVNISNPKKIILLFGSVIKNKEKIDDILSYLYIGEKDIEKKEVFFCNQSVEDKITTVFFRKGVFLRSINGTSISANTTKFNKK